jgi:hypothetical protein
MMLFSMPRVIASVAVVGAAGALALTALSVSDHRLPPVSQAAVAGTSGAAATIADNTGAGDRVAQVSPPAKPDSGVVRVAAPSTRVGVDKARGKVRVDAPYTNVRVDPDRGRVRVRAPYVNLDIDW